MSFAELVQERPRQGRSSQLIASGWSKSSQLPLRLPSHAQPLPFELIAKALPDEIHDPEHDADHDSSGIYEYVAANYPTLLEKIGRVLITLTIALISIFSFLLGDNSDWAIVAGVAMFVSAGLCFIFRMALKEAIAMRNFVISPEQERRLLRAIDELRRRQTSMS